jgi:hypothetical protein
VPPLVVVGMLVVEVDGVECVVVGVECVLVGGGGAELVVGAAVGTGAAVVVVATAVVTGAPAVVVVFLALCFLCRTAL